MNIGVACKQIAKAKRISAAEISRETGLGESYLSMLFNGKIEDPQFRRIHLIAQVLDISLDDLAGYAEEHGE